MHDTQLSMSDKPLVLAAVGRVKLKRKLLVDSTSRVDWAFRARSRELVDYNPASRENVMRRSLEALLGQPCPKARPAFLRNPASNRCLELDAWCERLKIGCEFQGIQHSEYPNPVHTRRAQFYAQVQRDQLKAALCEKHSVRLVLVPHTVTREQMSSFLHSQLHEQLNGVINELEGIPDATDSSSEIQLAPHARRVTSSSCQSSGVTRTHCTLASSTVT